MPIAVVTGAGIRVGRAVALGLARDGYDLVLHTNQSPPDETAEAVRALGRQVWLERADLADAAAVDALAARLVAAHPVIDVLVNSAGVFGYEPFAGVTRASYRRTQTVNAEAPYFLSQGLLPSLLRSAAPVVVNITDVLAERATAGLSSYAMSKAALIMLTRALAVELAPKVRVNAVSPGVAAFPPDTPEAERVATLQRVPLGREGTPEDIAAAVVYLARAIYVTGQVIAVDGGRSAAL